MNAALILANFTARGFTVRADESKLWITPAKDLTDQDRALITRFKPALLATITGHPAYSCESGWPGYQHERGWLPTPPVCRANDMLDGETCPVPPFCHRCPEKYLDCPDHGSVQPTVTWQVIGDGRRQLRATCPDCGRWLRFLEQNDYWLSLLPPEPMGATRRAMLRRRATSLLVDQGNRPELAAWTVNKWTDEELLVRLKEADLAPDGTGNQPDAGTFVSEKEMA